MVGAAYNARSFGIFPIGNKLSVFHPGAFCGFHKGKRNMYAAHFHLFNPTPIYPCLVFTHINAVDRIARRNSNAKMLVLFVMERVFKNRKNIITNLLAQEQDHTKNKQKLLKQAAELSPIAGHFELKRVKFHSICREIPK